MPAFSWGWSRPIVLKTLIFVVPLGTSYVAIVGAGAQVYRLEKL